MSNKPEIRLYVTKNDMTVKCCGGEYFVPAGTYVSNMDCDGPSTTSLFVNDTGSIIPMMHRETGVSITKAEYAAYKSSPGYVAHKDPYVINSGAAFDIKNHALRVGFDDIEVPKNSVYYREDADTLAEKYLGKDAYVISYGPDFKPVLEERVIKALGCVPSLGYGFKSYTESVMLGISGTSLSDRTYNYSRLVGTDDFQGLDKVIVGNINANCVSGYAIILKSDYDSENGDWKHAFEWNLIKQLERLADHYKARLDAVNAARSELMPL